MPGVREVLLELIVIELEIPGEDCRSRTVSDTLRLQECFFARQRSVFFGQFFARIFINLVSLRAWTLVLGVSLELS